MPNKKNKHKPRQHQAKRPRSEISTSESDISNTMAKSNVSYIEDTGFDQDFHTLNTLLETFSKDENTTKKAVTIILNHESFRSHISDILLEKVSTLESRIDSLEYQLDDLEQYSRRNCIKITGVAEGKEENTDEVALNVINKLILGPDKTSISLDKVERSHRVGKPRDDRPRDIIVKLTSYRDRALVYAKKSNLKTYNQNELNAHKIFINESLTRKRMDLLVATKKIFKEKRINSVWTYDGRIMAKTHTGKKWTITRSTDIVKLKEFIRSERPQPVTSTPAGR